MRRSDEGREPLNDATRREQARWLTGTPLVLTSAYAAATERVRHRAPSLREDTAVLAVGLEFRIGRLLGGRELRTYRRLRERGAELPRGVAVCDRCNLVFRPRRKSAAYRCDACHAGHTRTGERALQLTCCAVCGHSFEPIRSDARYCSTRCRVRAHRTARRQG